jgi:hypothetical protein
MTGRNFYLSKNISRHSKTFLVTSLRPYRMWRNVVDLDIISAISQNQSTSENNFWIDMTGYDFTRFATTYIRDSMALVQCMDAKKHLWRPCYRLLQTVDIMFCKSTYSSRCIWPVWRNTNSIKSAERERRTKASLHPCTELVPCYLWCKLSTKGQNPATKELGKLHFRTASLDLIYKNSSLYHLQGEKMCGNFVNSALSVGQSVNFYSPISKSNLKTFEHMNAKTYFIFELLH